MSGAGGSLAKKAGIVVFARIITTLIDLAIAIATLRILTKTDFAIIGYVLMIHELARNLATLGFPESVFYYFERIAPHRKRAFVRQTGGLLLGSSAATAGLILGLNTMLPSLLGAWDPATVARLQDLLPWMALVALLEIPTWPVSNILLAQDRQKDAAWFEALTSLATFLCVVGPLALGMDLMAAIHGLAMYSVVRFVASAILMHRVLPRADGLVDAKAGAEAGAPGDQPADGMKGSGVSIREQLRFSLPIGLSAYVGKLNRNVDKVIVSLMLPVSALAEYTIGAQEIPIIRVIPFAVGSVLISRFVSLQLAEKRDELLALWHKGVEKVSLMVVPLTVLAILLAPHLIGWIATTERADYAGAVLPFQIYNMIVLIRITHYGSLLQAFGDTRGVLLMSINLVVANIVLSIPFTLWFGITGTALATLIANLYNWVVYLKRIARHMEIPAWKVLPFPHYGRVLGSALVSAAGAWGVLRLAALIQGGDASVSAPGDLGDLLSMGILSAAYLALFALTGTMAGAIRQDDRSRIARLALRWLPSSFRRPA